MTYPNPYQSGPQQPMPASGQPYQGQPYQGQPYQPGGYAPVPGQGPAVPKSAGAAVALELVPGLFGIFGIGNIYAGKMATGIVLMVSFWVFFWINVLLTFIVIGWITLPMTWVAYLVAGPVLALRATERYNSQLLSGHR
ncbi:TM2 domain-containing membrane protein YozV [Micromonospora sp. Llam0]|uniref:hypothetical protein n=1 Tax=Micromonospora sp. Llam0 TaxID=2485143 RepID=UPI000F4A99A0|nr:hypothetical protein [Micromonospora sp. Llam0]ROO58712.1 TM2 domain-containing membrane protein YozV [Micromonospora sp. Llam0]